MRVVASESTAVADATPVARNVLLYERVGFARLATSAVADLRPPA